MKDYPLKVEGLDGHGGWVWSKGIHDKETFLAEVNAAVTCAGEEPYYKDTDVRYSYGRWIPDSSGEYKVVFYPYDDTPVYNFDTKEVESRSDRGCFPVTFISY